MFCEKCGTQLNDNTTFCTNCGYKIPSFGEDTAQVNQGANVFSLFNRLFSSSLFLAACILTTVQTAIKAIYSLILLNLLSIPLPVLITVSMWLIYTSAKSSNSMGYKTPFKILSVVITIEWVVMWVLVGLLAVLAFLSLALSGSMSEVLPQVFATLGYFVADDVFATLGIVLFVVFIIVAGICVVLNIFCYGNLKKCAKSFAITAESGQMVVYKLRVTKVWLIVLSVFSGISALGALSGDFLSFVSSGCSVATLIILSLIADKIIKETNCN